ncbi:serine repeat antigen 1 (SERA1) [Plasmodium ovale wallikeri]|uniref:Serine repeat antigen 1 (SERA1) n=1 Tax=Plasmodium ovale wallikeri TaxID=864142 RepID=A0A1A8YJR1_PLAOA|nr:serine repeat antigen 1 (SERA1) [Plasmodium ovale wallikeri]
MGDAADIFHNSPQFPQFPQFSTIHHTFPQVLIKSDGKKGSLALPKLSNNLEHHINKVSTESGRKYTYKKRVREDIKSDTYHDTTYLPPSNQSNADAIYCNEQYCDRWKDKNGCFSK